MKLTGHGRIHRCSTFSIKYDQYTSYYEELVYKNGRIKWRVSLDKIIKHSKFKNIEITPIVCSISMRQFEMANLGIS